MFRRDLVEIAEMSYLSDTYV